MPFSSRATATTTLTKIFAQGISLNQALLHLPHSKDTAFIQELCYGVLRWHEQLIAIIKLLLDKPLKDKDKDIELLLCLGVYQLLHLKTPAHAAINETVQAARELNKSWATGLINAILRKFLREEDATLKKINGNHVAHYSHPQWLLDLLKKSYPDHWQEIATANNQRPPMNLRVNQLKISRDEYLKLLTENNIAADKISHTQQGLALHTPCDVRQLPGFAEGLVSVQDSSAQLAAELLELNPGQVVLDACAAPGGKTAHILETEPDLKQLIAIDIDAARLEKVQENLQRLELCKDKIILLSANAADPKSWWNNQLFDRILLDAPCSGTGVIRRHPDIKILRRKTDIEKLAQQQLELLNALWPSLKPQGILVYATCSVLPHENTDVIQQFIKTHADAKEKPIIADWGIKTELGRQILTGKNNGDGFYYARLEKI